MLVLISHPACQRRPRNEGQAARERPRALGVAMEIALYLARGKATPGVAASPMHGTAAAAKGRVLLISTGPTTKVRATSGPPLSAGSAMWYYSALVL